MTEKIIITLAATLLFLAAICFIIQPFTTDEFFILALAIYWSVAFILIASGVEIIKISRQ